MGSVQKTTVLKRQDRNDGTNTSVPYSHPHPRARKKKCFQIIDYSEYCYNLNLYSATYQRYLEQIYGSIVRTTALYTFIKNNFSIYH